jgi:hypothetical protein
LFSNRNWWQHHQWGRRLVPGGPVCLRWFDSSRPCPAPFSLLLSFFASSLFPFTFPFSSFPVRFTALILPALFMELFVLKTLLDRRC